MSAATRTVFTAVIVCLLAMFGDRFHVGGVNCQPVIASNWCWKLLQCSRRCSTRMFYATSMGYGEKFPGKYR